MPTLTSPPLRTLPTERRKHVLHRLFPTPASLLIPRSGLAVGRARFPDDPAMSTQHVELTVAGDFVHLRDCGSKNGTWRDGERVEDAPLVDGDVLRLGDSFFLYRREPVELNDADVPGLLGVSPQVRALRADLARAAPTRATVLLLGETGTGKSHAARALHVLSGRRGELVHVNCAAIPESVAESTLFGHKAGAFTDAKSDSPGLFRAAHRSTLFLDEVGLLSPASQARLLLALESGCVTPVGGTTPIAVDVRVIVATNEDITDTRRFRADLRGRLAGVTIHLPPLRERREDLLPLLTASLGPSTPPLTADAVDLLFRWHWPYNVREVEKVAAELRLRGDGLPSLGAGLLVDRFVTPRPPVPAPTPSPAPRADDPPPDPEALMDLLREADGNVSEVARRVGRSSKQVYRWCARHGIEPSRFRS